MRYIYSILAIFVGTGIISCSKQCPGKVINVGLRYGKNDTFKVYIKGNFIAERYVDSSFEGRFYSPAHRLSKFCATTDSVLVNVHVNQRDTSFYIQTKEIKEIYLAASVDKRIIVFLNKEKGGLGEFTPYH